MINLHVAESVYDVLQVRIR